MSQDRGPRINHHIRIRQVRVIDEDNKQLGIMEIRDALAMANERELDLVEIAPTASPPTCKLMDYGKYKFDQKKKGRGQKKTVQRRKEVKLRPKCDAHDLKESSRREMLTPQVRINGALAWGLGWGLESVAGSDYFWHWGDNGTFHCFAIGDPSKRSGLAVFTNSNFGPKLYQRIINHATGHDHPAFLWI